VGREQRLTSQPQKIREFDADLARTCLKRRFGSAIAEEIRFRSSAISIGFGARDPTGFHAVALYSRSWVLHHQGALEVYSPVHPITLYKLVLRSLQPVNPEIVLFLIDTLKKLPP